jgi:hypothetical protein
MDDGLDVSAGVRDRVPPRWTSTADRVTYLLAEYRMGVYLALVAAVVLVATGRWSIPELPPQVGLALTGFAIGIIPATIIGKVAVVDRYMDSPKVNVAVVDPQDGVLVDAHEVPPGLWENRRRGEHPALRCRRGAVDWVVTEFEFLEDVSVLKVEGANPELADPVSIVATEGKLEEIYNDLLGDSKELTRLRATMKSKATRAEQAHANALLAAYEYGTSFNPGDTSSIVDADDWSDKREADAEDKDPARSDDPGEDRVFQLDMGEAMDDLAGNGANGNEPEAPEP